MTFVWFSVDGKIGGKIAVTRFDSYLPLRSRSDSARASCSTAADNDSPSAPSHFPSHSPLTSIATAPVSPSPVTTISHTPASQTHSRAPSITSPHTVMTSPVNSPLAASGAPVAGGHAVTVTASVTGHTVTGLKKATAPKERRASQPPPVPARTSVPVS